ncbi:uncharacterized protein METZ01_LOCUS195308, partial [marine metagenome]
HKENHKKGYTVMLFLKLRKPHSNHVTRQDI